jgi:hypothetical protein
MNSGRLQAIVEHGFTERQARLLELVMRHAGVCVPRQYAQLAGIAQGAKCNAFFDRLVRRGQGQNRDVNDPAAGAHSPISPRPRGRSRLGCRCLSWPCCSVQISRANTPRSSRRIVVTSAGAADAPI